VAFLEDAQVDGGRRQHRDRRQRRLALALTAETHLGAGDVGVDAQRAPAQEVLAREQAAQVVLERVVIGIALLRQAVGDPPQHLPGLRVDALEREDQVAEVADADQQHLVDEFVPRQIAVTYGGQ
jgi:hypothetical protein